MTILSGDIKLAKSQVMDDVPEGGGAPVAAVVTDGASNGIFNDISELDRAGGRVNMRKLFATVQTPNTDGYFGANVIVAEPPADPNVSVTLFTTGDTFDTRNSAKARVEAYLTQGPLAGGYLFGDHVAGQATVVMLQREELPIPASGDTFVLRKNEGLAGQVEQFIRVNKVSSRRRTFTDDKAQDFTRMEVTMQISDVLRYDFPGFDAQRYDFSISYAGRTKLYTTVVADAARYYGVVPLAENATLGDFTVQAEGIFTQIVPSTRVETPIADARMNQQASALVTAGVPLVQTFTLGFTTAQAMFIGGSILPGSLSIVRGGITLKDKGGLLYNDTAQVGTVDYANGVVTLSTNVFGTVADVHTVTYTPAATPTLVSDSVGVPITKQGQRTSYAITLDPPPARRSLQVSYRALGKWYVLTEDGSGAIKGSDSAFGAGTLNFGTGTVQLTLGALPDVGSQLILTFVPSVVAQPINAVAPSGPALPSAFGKILKATTALKPGTVTVTWNDGQARSATDVNGQLSGDATGKVLYGKGEIEFRPNKLPAINTPITVTVGPTTLKTEKVHSMIDGGAAWTFQLTAPIKPRSLDLALYAQYAQEQFPGTDKTILDVMHVFDDGAGNLQVGNVDSNLTIGAIDYASGACTINKTVNGFKNQQQHWEKITVLEDVPVSSGSLQPKNPIEKVVMTGWVVRSLSLTFLNGPGGSFVNAPAWAWWTSYADTVEARFSGADAGATDTYNFTLDSVFVGAAGAILGFTLGGHRYTYVQASNQYVKDPSPTTGAGTPAGTRVVLGGVPGVQITDWQVGSNSLPTDVFGATSPGLSGDGAQLVETVTFRTAISPLFNGGFQVSGTFQDGTTFTATPDTNGYIKTATLSTVGVIGKVDYDSGVATLLFGKLKAAAGLGTSDAHYLEIPGVEFYDPVGVQADTLRYNATGFSYIPLNADILGLDPVRLPNDGRVPIFRPGSFAVLGNTKSIQAAVSNGQTINCGRVRLSRVRVIGDDGAVINTGYTADLEAGTVTFTDVSGYSQPVTVEHRIEDMMLVSDAQINGQLSFTRAITHNYPADGSSYVSSALVIGDMHARVSLTFDQQTWSNVFSDDLIGNTATGTFNTITNPITVQNKGALTERWAVVFTSATAFNVIGEHVGVIAVGNTGTDCAPLNPAAGAPYFTIPAAGWGTGWVAGNVVRFNTVGAVYPVWALRTIQQGPETVDDDSFTLLVRGDVDKP